MRDARSRGFVHNKLRTAKVTILILPLKQVSEMGQDVKESPFSQPHPYLVALSSLSQALLTGLC